MTDLIRYRDEKVAREIAGELIASFGGAEHAYAQLSNWDRTDRVRYEQATARHYIPAAQWHLVLYYLSRAEKNELPPAA